MPRLWKFLMSIVAEPENREFVLADLEDSFEEVRRLHGHGEAMRWCRRQALKSLGPCIFGRVSRSLRRASQGDSHHSSDGGARRLEARSVWWCNSVFVLLNDFRYGARNLAKTPLAAFVVVVSLGVGIGATSIVFTMTNALLFRHVAGTAPSEDVVTLYTSEADSDAFGQNSFPDFQDARELTAFSNAAAIRLGAVNMGEARSPRRLLAEIVTSGYFEVLGVPLRLGRAFLPEETVVGSADRVVVISHRLWQRQFAGSADAIGATLRLNGHQFTVVGVAPEGTVSRILALKVDVWVPIGMPGGTFRATPEALVNRGDRDFQVVARLREGATIEQAQAQLAVLAGRLSAAHPEEWLDDRGNARTFTLLSDAESRLPPNLKVALGTLSGFLFGISGMILLIACTNVAGIFLARAIRRHRELAVRASLGASRIRIVSMLLAESLLPALAGGVLGILLTVAATKAIGTLSLPIAIPIEFDFSVDRAVVGFALAASVGACLLFGLAPALTASRPNLLSSLQATSGSTGRNPGRFGLRNILIVGQVAVSLVLLVGAALSIRTVQGVMNIDMGFNSERIAVMSKRLPGEAVTNAVRVRAAREIIGRLSAHPGVETVHLSRAAEATVFSNLANADVSVDGRPSMDVGERAVSYNTVTPGYLEMLEIRLLAGRTFTPEDAAGAPPVAVVNETFARRYWPDRSALGRHFTAANRRGGQDLTGESDVTLEVIGIVADGRYADIEEPAIPYYWTSLYQDSPREVLIHAKGRSNAEDMVQLLRTEVRLAEDELPMVLPSTLKGMTSVAAAMYAIIGRILGAGGLFGLVLLSVGIYGVVAFSVTQRAREMAIRQAIGARQREVIKSIALDGVRLSVVGTIVGLAIAAPLVRIGESTTFGVSPLDPLAFGASVLVLLGVALAASLIPARRITRSTPMVVLRQEQ